MIYSSAGITHRLKPAKSRAKTGKKPRQKMPRGF
jgi:hypothetical protein